MPKNGNRRNDLNDEQEDIVKKYVKLLFNDGIRGKIPQSELAKLKNSINNDDIIDKIEEVFYERSQEIARRAKKFTKLIEKKFGNKGYPLHIILKNSIKYKIKYNLSDAEFQEFKNNYEKLLYSRTPDYATANFTKLNTKMGKLFGDNLNLNTGLNIKNSEYSILQELIDFNEGTKSNHASIILQSLQYTTYPLEVSSASYNPEKNNLSNAIYPLLVALFVPKIQSLDEHFLYSNIANIVVSRNYKMPLKNIADLRLLWSLINDSNDVVCNYDSALTDLKIRANLQNNLWINVYNLRSGKFFESTQFMEAIDKCKISMYDAPDLAYIGDEGVILKRLLASFAYRPLVVSTLPIYGNNGIANPVNFPIISNRIVTTPLLTLRLPLKNTIKEINLNEALVNAQIYLENGVFVPKTQELIHSDGTIIFHVPRRNLAPQTMYKQFIPTGTPFSGLPLNIYHIEYINQTEIKYDYTYEVENKEVMLRSAIYLETHTVNDREIILTTGAVISEISGNIFSGISYKYSPKVSFNNNANRQVFTKISNAQDFLCTKGTIFIYSVI
jgi:hypothetical protein